MILARWLGVLLDSLFSIVRSWWLWFVFLILSVLGALASICQWFVSLLLTVISLATSLVSALHNSPSVDWSPFLGFLAKANYLFPINEIFVSASFLLGLWITCSSVRWIKSVIPTEAG